MIYNNSSLYSFKIQILDRFVDFFDKTFNDNSIRVATLLRLFSEYSRNNFKNYV